MTTTLSTLNIPATPPTSPQPTQCFHTVYRVDLYMILKPVISADVMEMNMNKYSSINESKGWTSGL